MIKQISKTNLYLICFVTVFVMLVIPTAYKVIKSHNNRAREVLEKEIIEAAQNCINDEKCEKGQIKIKTLYEFKYLDEIYDPISKKVYSEESTVTIGEGSDATLQLIEKSND